MASSDNYEDDFDTDTGDESSCKLPAPGKDFGSTDHLLQSKHTRMNDAGKKGQRGVAGRRSSLSKEKKEPDGPSREAKKKLDAYKRANERLRGELDKCIDSQFRVRELEDQLKSKHNEMKKLVQENGRLEKMLEKPAKDPVEVDNGHVDRIRTLMNDMRLLQDKTRKYKSRAMDSERSVQKLTVQLGELQVKNDKLLVLLKEVKKDGMDSKERKELEAKVASNEKKAQSLTRELQMVKKKHATEVKKFRAEALAANQEVERVREKAEKSEGQLKEVQMEARILSLKLRNERRSQKSKVKKVKSLELAEVAPSSEAATSHRTVDTTSTKEPEGIEMSFLEKSILAGVPSPRRREIMGQSSHDSPGREGSDLQAKMDALRAKQAQVNQQEEQKAATRHAEVAEAEYARTPDAPNSGKPSPRAAVSPGSSTHSPRPALSLVSSKQSSPRPALTPVSSNQPSPQPAPSPASSKQPSPQPAPSRGSSTHSPRPALSQGTHTPQASPKVDISPRGAFFVTEEAGEAVEDEEEDGYSDDEYEVESPQKSQEDVDSAFLVPVPEPLAEPEPELVVEAVTETPRDLVEPPAVVAAEQALPGVTPRSEGSGGMPSKPNFAVRKQSLPSKPSFGGGDKKKKRW